MEAPSVGSAAVAFAAARIAFARDLRDQAYNEGTRSVTGGSALLGALSQSAAIGVAAAAWAASRNGAIAGAIVLGTGGVLFITAFALVVLSMRPRLPPPSVRHGWAPLAHLDVVGVLDYVDAQARDLATHYATDARALTRVAMRKHRLFRCGCDAVLGAFAIAAVGTVLTLIGI
ncbi:MAG TPA: Pycsar system effector family protein [Streptomyces sp.]